MCHLFSNIPLQLENALQSPYLSFTIIAYSQCIYTWFQNSNECEPPISLSFPIMVVIACWHLALAGSAPNLISLNSPTLAAAGAMADKFCVYNEEQYPRSHLSGECGMFWVRAPSVSYADALSNNSKLEN